MAEISAARLNNLQARIEAIMGNGAGQNGYGESVSSYQVSNTSGQLVLAADINAIYADMVRARLHQVGTTPTEIQELIRNLNIIADESSFYVNDSGISVQDPSGALKGIADFENLMTSIETDKFLMDIGQASLEPGIGSSRQSGWNGLIYHTFSVVFADADHRRHFFNSGGEIRISAANASASTPKGRDWSALLNEVGTISFNHTTTTTTNSGSGQAIGNYDLTSSYQTIYSKTGAGTYSGIYAGNLFTIKAKESSASTIEFRLEFNDVVADPQIDNNVDGNLSTTVQHYRADTTNVTVAAPTYSTITALSSFATPVPPPAPAPPPPPPPPPCQDPAPFSDSLAIYQPGMVLVYNDNNVFNNRSLVTSTKTSAASTINGWYLSDLGRPAEYEGLNYWYNLWVSAGEAATKAQFDISKQPELARGGVKATYTYCQYYGSSAPPPPPPPASNVLSYDGTVCISVIDESSPSSGTIESDWNSFSSHYPNRRFVLLQPTGYSSDRLKIPSSYNGSLQTSIRRDNGSTGSREDWFGLANLSSLQQGAVVSLSIDNSGSMTTKQVQASYDYFKTRVANAGLQLVEPSMSGERWAKPHDRSMPAFQIPPPPPPPPPATATVNIYVYSDTNCWYEL